MKVLNKTTLLFFRPNQKFLWNDHVYVVHQHDGNMTEVHGNGRYWAWPSSSKVNPVIL